MQIFPFRGYVIIHNENGYFFSRKIKKIYSNPIFYPTLNQAKKAIIQEKKLKRY